MDNVLVAGAGPTGLAVACGLRLAGVPTRVVDAAEGPATTSRALGLQPRGVEVLRRLGALVDLPERAVHMAGTIIHAHGQERLRLNVPSAEVIGGRTALVISQVEIETQLRQRLREMGVNVEWGREVVAVTPQDNTVPVSFSDGTDDRAAWLIGCDGAGSCVRKAIGIPLVGETAAEQFLLADARLRLPVRRDYASMWCDENTVVATIPLPGQDRWRLMGPLSSDPAAMSTSEIVDMLTTSMRELGLEGDITDVTWTSTFRVHRRLAASYRHGRVLLAGDAAHIHSPVGGQGMNTGIGDAENLAWKLALVATGRAGAGLLDSYESERRPVAATVVNAVGSVDKLLLTKNPLLALLRDRVVLPLVNRPVVQRKIWRKASQLDISYRRGPLTPRPNRRVAGIRCGDRVPDVPCLRADGTSTSLHNALRGRWALLSTADGELAQLARERLGERQLVVLRRSRDPAMLVRPDAHLGWQGTAPEDLDRWLNGMRHTAP